MMASLAPPTPEQNSPEREAERFSEALHRYWGYESFRPGQANIVKSIAAGRDACVVMPTGGGKSLCYQLPAVLNATTAIVISPLIALMQDQVAQLLQMGISAACLNAATLPEERTHILQRAATGKYQLLQQFAADAWVFGDNAFDRDAGIDGAKAAFGCDGFRQRFAGVGFFE